MNTFLSDAANIPAGYQLTAYYLNSVGSGLTGNQGLLATDMYDFTNGLAFGKSDTATIGFWANQNGQAVINSLNGGSGSTNLSAWLASNFPNLYGINAGPNNLTGDTNADVAAYFITLKSMSGQKTYAQILGTALAVYVTSSNLTGGSNATVNKYGFNVTPGGIGGALFDTGSDGTGLGLNNNTNYTVFALLQAANNSATNGDGTLGSSAFNAANDLFSNINQKGDIS
jgi:hypothetical protein